MEGAGYEAAWTSVVFASGALVVTAYEWFAIKTNRVPTITELVKKGGWPARIGFVVVFTLAMVDHFITGWIL